MNWPIVDTRDILMPRTENFRDFGHTDKSTKRNRNNILQKSDNTCRFCGGYYPKYLRCSYYPHAKCDDVSCGACYLITHLNFGIHNEINIYYSELSQIKIVRDTIDFIIENGTIPTPQEIDSNVKSVPISILEYINIMNNYEDVPKEFENYKIFFTQKFGINFIVSNYSNNKIGFVNEFANENYVSNNTIKYKLVKHIPSEEEIKFINKHFNL